MTEVTESMPAKPVRPIRKDQGSFVRKRSARGGRPVEEVAEGVAPTGPEDQDGPPPLEHVDTYA